MVAGRGATAVKVIRAARALQLGTVAVYSKPERDALHTRLADSAYQIGPVPIEESYLNQGPLLTLAALKQIDRIYPALPELAADPAFTKQAEEAGLTVVGPSAQVLADLDQESVPNQPAAPDAEVPFFVDGQGNFQGLLVAPFQSSTGTVLGLQMATAGSETTVILNQVIDWLQPTGYRGLGTVKLTGDAQSGYQIQGLTPGYSPAVALAESVWDVDLVQAQLQLSWQPDWTFPPSPTVHPAVILVEIKAADSGSVTALHLPTGLGLRLESDLYPGAPINTSYDQTIATLIATAPDLATAYQRLYLALGETVIAGLPTNLDQLVSELNQLN